MKMGMNKKAISGIVITLIIVLISIAALIIVWMAVSSAIKGGSQGVEMGVKCLNNVVETERVTCSEGDVNKICDVQFVRTGTGRDEIGGVKLVFRNRGSGASSPAAIDISGNIEFLIGKTETGIDTGMLNADEADKIEITVYFKDESGNEQLCSQPSSFNFS